jgi:hypothetical protein
MSRFRQRRWILSGATLLAGLLVVAAWWFARTALRPVDHYTGWLLLGLLLLLTLFNARKKLPFLPLWGASAWLQFHVYTGWFSALVFLLHTEAKVPGGPLGFTLWAGYLLVTASGVFGLWLSRWLPPQLARSGESLVYERIPRLRRELEDEAATLVRQAETEAASSTLADFHRQILAPYFAHTPALFAPLGGDDAAHHRARHDLAALRRFLNEREMIIADQLDEIMDAKRNLDAQFGGQRLLKAWLFAHIPLTYGLLVVIAAHVWLVAHYSHRL